MNRNSIRRVTTCCLTAAVVLANNSFVSHAAISAGAGSLISAVQEEQIDSKTTDNKKADNKTANNKTTDNKTADNKTTDDNKTDNKTTDDKTTDDKKTDNKATDDKITDDKKTDNKTTDDKTTDNKAADDKKTDNKAADDKKTDNKAADDKITDDKKTDNKAADDKTTDDKKADKEEQSNSSTAGITQIFVNSLAPKQEAINTSIEVVQNEVPVVKTEYDDIAIAQVENYVNVRSVPGEEGEVLGKLYNNSACTVLGVEGEWYKVHSGNVEGYIKSDFLVLGDAELAKSVGHRVADVTTQTLNVRADASTEAELLGQVPEGEELSVVEEKDGWVKVAIEEGDGWVSKDFVDCSTHYVVAESKEEEEARLKKEEEERKAAEEAARRAAEEAEAARRAAESSSSGSSSSNSSSSSSSSSNSDSSSGSGGGSSEPARSYEAPSGGNGQAVANYACQFVGNPYVWGGTSLTNGADCSGFVMSVYAAFGVGLPHSSSALQGVGYGVSADAMQPGDIVCYSGHVGIYIGNNTIVHASTEATGIKYTSPANYRTIVAVRRIF